MKKTSTINQFTDQINHFQPELQEKITDFLANGYKKSLPSAQVTRSILSYAGSLQILSNTFTGQVDIVLN